MPDNAGSVRIARLVAAPIVITLLITLLRLEGELHQGSSVLFNRNAGGVGAIVGIAWLPFIFGPYFAARLARAGERPAGNGRVLLFAAVGLIVTIGAGLISSRTPEGTLSGTALIGLLLMVAAVIVQLMAWGALGKTLLAYAFGARIPVAIVMFYAMRGNWGTHYDALPGGYAGPADFTGKYVNMALIPQFIGWIDYTMVIGTLAAGVYLLIAHRSRAAVQPA
ncbi:MAG TPA: hypothetical protein VGZ29_02915 [Terriglobia bacterium]|nr:hypothetical protein [Terriglobia bacterium]